MSKQTHIERTAAEPRNGDLHFVNVTSIDQINPSIRILRLTSICGGIKFLPGQWVDLYIPSQPLTPPGGFTITSSPSCALPSPSMSPLEPWIELAIQNSPTNPIASHLWQDPQLVLDKDFIIRVGGSFTFPPPLVPNFPFHKVVFIAGGVGINPFMSMLTLLSETPAYQNLDVQFLYSLKDPGQAARHAKGMLFVERIAGAFRNRSVKGSLKLFLTGGEVGKGVVKWDEGDVPFEGRRMGMRDVEEALGGEKNEAVVYVCGPPRMTDEFVEGLVGKGGLGMERGRVFYEKWW